MAIDYAEAQKAVEIIRSICAQSTRCLRCPFNVNGYSLCGITGVNMNDGDNYKLRPERWKTQDIRIFSNETK